MKQLAIYHAPQECGEPYVMLIDLETGQPIRTIDIPEGYCYSGFEVEYYYEPTGEVIRKKHSATYLPEVGEVEHYRGDKYIYLKEIIDVEPWKLDLGEGDFMEGYNATLVYEISRKKQCYRFDSSKDRKADKMPASTKSNITLSEGYRAYWEIKQKMWKNTVYNPLKK